LRAKRRNPTLVLQPGGATTKTSPRRHGDTEARKTKFKYWQIARKAEGKEKVNIIEQLLTTKFLSKNKMFY